MKQQNKAYLFALIAVFMWSTIGSAFKLTLQYLEPVQMLLYASFISTIALLVIILAQRKSHLLRTITKKQFLNSAVNSFFNPFLYYVILLYAYDILLAQEAMVLNYAWPVVLTLLSVFMLRQRIGWKSILAILISFSGVLVIATNGRLLALHFSNPAGVALALGSTVIWALFWINNVRDKRDEVIKLFFNFAFGSMYILILSLFLGDFTIPAGKAIPGVVYIGLFEMSLAFFFWLRSLQLSLTTAKVSNLIFISPVLSLLFIRVFVGEPIHAATLAGLVLIISGIVMQRKF